MIVTVFILSMVGGFLSGYLGIGGAVVMVPLMLAVPPLFGFDSLPMKTIAGLSMVQAFFSSISGIVVHKKNRNVHLPTLLSIGIPMSLCSFAGSFLSRRLSNVLILIIFGGMVLAAFFILLFNIIKSKEAAIPVGQTEETDMITVNKKLSVLIGSVIGSSSGIVGAGGGFILTPVMVNFLKLPTKVAIGTSIGIIFLGSLSGFAGKLISLQINFKLAVPIIIGSVLAAQFGARVNKKTSPKILKLILLIVILLSFTQVISKLLQLVK